MPGQRSSSSSHLAMRRAAIQHIGTAKAMSYPQEPYTQPSWGWAQQLDPGHGERQRQSPTPWMRRGPGEQRYMHGPP